WGALAFVPFLWRASTRRLVSALFITFLVAASVGTALKVAVGRLRPCFSLQGVSALYGSPAGPSFPSGHALGSFTFAGFLTATAIEIARKNPDKRRVAWIASIAAVVFATSVALSRVYLGAHFPSDVATGALLGFLIGFGGAKAFQAYERGRAKSASP
ncbi:MAG: phosphatase PAP2 family protein, partial [Polyangiaceae bacterium]